MLHIRVPIAFVLTALLPLAFGARFSFRYPLWSLLAYGALTAFVLALYLPSATHF